MLKIPKNSAQNLNFWFIFGSFLITPSYTVAVTPQFLCQMKGLIEMRNSGKVVKFKNLKYFRGDGASMKWPIF